MHLHLVFLIGEQVSSLAEHEADLCSLAPFCWCEKRRRCSWSVSRANFRHCYLCIPLVPCLLLSTSSRTWFGIALAHWCREREGDNSIIRLLLLLRSTSNRNQVRAFHPIMTRVFIQERRHHCPAKRKMSTWCFGSFFSYQCHWCYDPIIHIFRRMKHFADLTWENWPISAQCLINATI